MHTIVDLETLKAINAARDILLEPHVWIGQNTLLLGGSYVGAGSVVGANSVVTAGRSRTRWAVYAGNPVRMLRQNATWDRESVFDGSTAQRVHNVRALVDSLPDFESPLEVTGQPTIGGSSRGGGVSASAGGPDSPWRRLMGHLQRKHERLR